MNYRKLQKLIDKVISGFGGGSLNATLRRSTGDRPCTIVVPGVKNKDQQMFAHSLRTVLISGLNLDVAPDNELDSLVFRGVVYKFDAAPTPISPDGITTVAWEAQVSTR
jgi:hypothetical protein